MNKNMSETQKINDLKEALKNVVISDDTIEDYDIKSISAY